MQHVTVSHRDQMVSHVMQKDSAVVIVISMEKIAVNAKKVFTIFLLVKNATVIQPV